MADVVLLIGTRHRDEDGSCFHLHDQAGVPNQICIAVQRLRIRGDVQIVVPIQSKFRAIEHTLTNAKHHQ